MQIEFRISACKGKHRVVPGAFVFLFLIAAGLAARPALAESQGGRYRNIYWQGSLPVQSFYDSNIYHTAESPVEDLGLRIAPSLTLSYKRPAWTIGWTGAYLREQYLGLYSAPRARTVMDTQGEGTLSFTTGLSLGAKYQYIDTEEPLHAEVEMDRRAVRRFRNLGKLQIGQKLGAGRLDVAVNYLFYYDHYANPMFRFLDAGTHNVQIRGTIKAFPRTAVFAETNVGRKVYTDTRLAQISENHTDFSLLAGAAGRWSPKIGATTMLGLRLFVFSESGFDASPIIRFDGSYKASALVNLSITYEHIMLDSTSSLYFVNDLLRLRWTRKLSRSWEAQLEGAGTLLRYSPPEPRTGGSTALASQNTPTLLYSPPEPRTDEVGQLRGGFQFAPVPVPRLTGYFGYNYQIRESSRTEVRYQAHSLNFEVSWSL